MTRGPNLDEIEGNIDHRDDDLTLQDRVDGWSEEVNRIELELQDTREELIAADEQRKAALQELDDLKASFETTDTSFVAVFAVEITDPLSVTPEGAVAMFNDCARDVGSKYAAWVREQVIPAQIIANPQETA